MNPQCPSRDNTIGVVLVVFESIHGILVENPLITQAISSKDIPQEVEY